MAEYVLPLQRLVEQFRKLPGVGGKSAVRMAFAVLNFQKEDIDEFAEALLGVKDGIHFCKKCFNFTETDLCDVCSNPDRDSSVVCVVEDARDIVAIERIRDYKGLYHVLGGVLSPMNGIGVEQLHVKELLARLADDSVKEVIVATNPSVEGEATAMYIAKLLKPFDIKVTRLAYGIPVGGDLEYADEITLRRAIMGRSEL